MSDPLGRLHPASGRLLAVVDETLAHCGAPERHPIWPLLRSVGQLPGDAVTEVEALSLDAFRQGAGLLRSHRERGAEVDDLLTAPSGWEGAAAEAAVAKLESARAGLRVLTANAGVLAGLAGDLAEWGERGRVNLARTLARALTSAQAVELTLTVGEAEPIVKAQAAADIGAEVLAEVAGFWAGAREMVRDRLARLEPAPTPRVTPAASGGGRLTVQR
jgi:hypothetical protein